MDIRSAGRRVGLRRRRRVARLVRPPLVGHGTARRLVDGARRRALPRGGPRCLRGAPGRSRPPRRDPRRHARPGRAVAFRAQRGRACVPRHGFGPAAQARARPAHRRPGHGRDPARRPGRAPRRRPRAADPPTPHAAGARSEDHRPRPPLGDRSRAEPPPAPTQDPRRPLGPDPGGPRQERHVPRGLGARLAARVRDRPGRGQPLRQHDRGGGVELGRSTPPAPPTSCPR